MKKISTLIALILLSLFVNGEELKKEGDHYILTKAGESQRFTLLEEVGNKLSSTDPRILYAIGKETGFSRLSLKHGTIVDGKGRTYTVKGDSIAVTEQKNKLTREYALEGDEAVVRSARLGDEEISTELLPLFSSDDFYLKHDLRGAVYDESTQRLKTKDGQEVKITDNQITYFNSRGEITDTIELVNGKIVVDDPLTGKKIFLSADTKKEGKKITKRYFGTEEGSDTTFIYDRNLKRIGFVKDEIEYSNGYWPEIVHAEGSSARIQYFSDPAKTTLCDSTRNPYCGVSRQGIQIIENGITYSDRCKGSSNSKCRSLRDCTTPACKKALDAYATANLGPALDDAYRTALSAKQLFPQLENFGVVDDFFQSEVGQLLTGEPSFGVCEVYSKRDARTSGYILDSKDTFSLLAHVEGQRSLLQFPNGTKEFFYTFTYQINANTDLTYNIDLYVGKTSLASLFPYDRDITNGEIVNGVGKNAFTQYSQNYYDRVCLRLSTATTCNTIIDVSTIPLLPSTTNANRPIFGKI